MANRRQIGYKYEEMAAAYLEKQGYQLLEKNYYSKWGEIDLILRKGDRIAFVEVKYRSDNRFGAPEEAVNWKKMQRIRKGAEWYLLQHGLAECEVSLDLVAIQGQEIRHLPGALHGGGLGWIW